MICFFVGSQLGSGVLVARWSQALAESAELGQPAERAADAGAAIPGVRGRQPLQRGRLLQRGEQRRRRRLPALADRLAAVGSDRLRQLQHGRHPQLRARSHFNRLQERNGRDVSLLLLVAAMSLSQ